MTAIGPVAISLGDLEQDPPIRLTGHNKPRPNHTVRTVVCLPLGERRQALRRALLQEDQP